MNPEEQLQVVDALANTVKDESSEVRKEAFYCLVELGLDGLLRIVDVIDDANTNDACRKDAVEALGGAFAQGKVDKSGMIKHAIKALESCLGKDKELCEAAIVALGEIGTQAISTKPRLLALITDQPNNNRMCVKAASALLKISPVH